jgi:translation initiation factor eIF-2B subunit beta
VRRIIAAVREEVMNNIGEAEVDGMAPNTNKPNVSRTKQHDRSLESMLWALPQHVKPSRAIVGQRRSQQHQRSGSLGDVLETDSASASLDLPPQFHQNRPDLKQSLMEAIQEITSDLEDLHKNINDQATNHIHAGEVILAYGNSRTVKTVRMSRLQRMYGALESEGRMRVMTTYTIMLPRKVSKSGSRQTPSVYSCYL